MEGWDLYPFILLSLFLSILAGLQGAILLIAAKRQDAIAAALSQHDHATNLTVRDDVDAVLEISNRQHETITELQVILPRSTRSGKTLRRSPRIVRQARRGRQRSNAPDRGPSRNWRG